MNALRHAGTQELSTERLILRRYTMDDASLMFHNYCSDPDVTKYLIWKPHQSIDDSRSILHSWVTEYDNPRFYHWAIEYKKIREPIGSISAVASNEQQKSVEIGYCIGKKWWGMGIMSEALSRVIAFFIEEIAFSRIESFHDTRNPASGKVMQKSGLQYQRTIKKHHTNNQGVCDCDFYALTKEDYYEKQGRVCPWALRSTLEWEYHDTEWGVPLRNDAQLFELLVLEYMQAGLSWQTILQKREAMRSAFDRFSPKIISRYDGEKINKLMNNPSIIRNRKKLEALPVNARAFLRVQQEYGFFWKYLWAFVDHVPLIRSPVEPDDIPTRSELSETISKDMKKRGFVFIGPTIIYSYLQAAGLINDHLVRCYLHKK